MSSTISPIAPYTSTVQYPLDALLSLGGKVVEELWAHHKSLRDQARAAGDTAKEDEEDDELNDIWVVLPTIDQVTYNERLVDKDYVRCAAPSEDPDIVKKRGEQTSAPITRKKQELDLLTMGRSPKIPTVIPAACDHRRKTRGPATHSDPEWEKEDALLDLLVFLSKYSSAGIFAPVS